ncbi:hypothetical protein ACWEF6_01715 [Amycolatopsis sp. NPDC004772]
MAEPLAYIGDGGDVWIVAPDGRPRWLNIHKARLEDHGFRSIDAVNEDTYFGPIRAAHLED